MVSEFEVGIGTTKKGECTFVVEPVRTIKVFSASSTSYHESVHALAARKTGDYVDEVTVIPGSGYAGRTKMYRFNPIAFAAAHAMGCDGTGYDMFILSRMGYSPGLVVGLARQVLSGCEDEINAVAGLLEERKTIGGNEIDEVIDWVRNPEMRVRVFTSLGEERPFVTRIKKGQTSISLKYFFDAFSEGGPSSEECQGLIYPPPTKQGVKLYPN